ncbi:MAG: hypothetical protein Q8L45_15805 [Xanthomonadaceae bacterium]|nr:hypothetical protein [Xanthomonadaceae bacterium]MDZ4116108.1 hypothetical protein [Xanthomonadaceae bacterium]
MMWSDWCDEAGAMWSGGVGDAVARMAVQWDVVVGVLPVRRLELCDGAGVARALVA